MKAFYQKDFEAELKKKRKSLSLEKADDGGYIHKQTAAIYFGYELAMKHNKEITFRALDYLMDAWVYAYTSLGASKKTAEKMVAKEMQLYEKSKEAL